MAEPRRIQRKRTRGWRMPEGAVSVTRPSKWGNPYRVEVWGAELAIALYRNTLRGDWSPALLHLQSNERYSEAYELHLHWRARFKCDPFELARSELRGRDLACFCREGEPCHADVLLEVANA